jgi:hypothetical protein
MKKIVAVVAFFTISISLMNAQGEVRFGFQLSPTFGWMSTDNNKINTNGTNLGLKLGMVGEFYFQEQYSISTGIGFFFNAGGTILHDDAGVFWRNSEVPTACTNSFETRGPNLKYSVQYVEIPLGLKMRTREFGYLRYYVEPNIGLGFRTQATGDVKNEGDECNDIDIQKDVGLLNLFWGVGAGVEYSVSETTSLVAGIGTQFGFVDITKDDDVTYRNNVLTDPVEEDSKGVSRAIILRLGVLF